MAQQQAEQGLSFARKVGFATIEGWILGQLGLVRSLRELTDRLGSFDDADLREVDSERNLAGKPAPDTYLAAADMLHVTAHQAAVFEDAQAGVTAGRAGGFALVVGVDRVGQAAELYEHGADIVVKDLSDLLDHDGETK